MPIRQISFHIFLGFPETQPPTKAAEKVLCVPCSSGGWWPIQHGANALDIAYVANVLRWRRSSLFASFFGLQGGTLWGPKWALGIHEEINITWGLGGSSQWLFLPLWDFCRVNPLTTGVNILPHSHDPLVVRHQPYPLDFAVVSTVIFPQHHDERWENPSRLMVDWWSGPRFNPYEPLT
jgi:hypothetical protein